VARFACFFVIDCLELVVEDCVDCGARFYHGDLGGR